jgi:hypothetical protein
MAAYNSGARHAQKSPPDNSRITVKSTSFLSCSLIGRQLSLFPVVPQRRTPFSCRFKAISRQQEPVKVINNSTDIDHKQFL